MVNWIFEDGVQLSIKFSVLSCVDIYKLQMFLIVCEYIKTYEFVIDLSFELLRGYLVINERNSERFILIVFCFYSMRECEIVWGITIIVKYY